METNESEEIEELKNFTKVLLDYEVETEYTYSKQNEPCEKCGHITNTILGPAKLNTNVFTFDWTTKSDVCKKFSLIINCGNIIDKIIFSDTEYVYSEFTEGLLIYRNEEKFICLYITRDYADDLHGFSGSISDGKSEFTFRWP